MTITAFTDTTSPATSQTTELVVGLSEARIAFGRMLDAAGSHTPDGMRHFEDLRDTFYSILNANRARLSQ